MMLLHSPPMRHASSLLLCAALSLALPSCAPAPKQPPGPQGLQHVFYHRTGGIAGVDDRVEIQPDGHVGVVRRGQRPREFPLTREQVKLLRDALENFASFKREYPAPPRSADPFRYVLRYGGKTVTASEANSNVPPPLREAWLMLDAIAQQHP